MSEPTKEQMLEKLLEAVELLNTLRTQKKRELVMIDAFLTSLENMYEPEEETGEELKKKDESSKEQTSSSFVTVTEAADIVSSSGARSINELIMMAQKGYVYADMKGEEQPVETQETGLIPEADGKEKKGEGNNGIEGYDGGGPSKRNKSVAKRKTGGLYGKPTR